MNLGLLVPVLILAPICLGALALLPKIWRAKADIQRPEATEKWWPFGEALRESFVRGMPVGILACTALTVSMALTLVEESTSGSTSRTAAQAAWIAFLVFIALILVDLSVTLFSRGGLWHPRQRAMSERRGPSIRTTGYSQTAPVAAEPTSLAYFASTPEV